MRIVPLFVRRQKPTSKRTNRLALQLPVHCATSLYVVVAVRSGAPWLAPWNCVVATQALVQAIDCPVLVQPAPLL